MLDGDPAIRWQVKRDLVDAPADEVAAERALVSFVGWGRQLLDCQDPEGTWAGGLYSPKWTSTTYTLLLRHCGLDPANEPARRGVSLIRPDDDGRTRLLVPERTAYGRRTLRWAMAPLGPVSFVMTRRTLLGVKRRAELGPGLRTTA